MQGCQNQLPSSYDVSLRLYYNEGGFFLLLLLNSYTKYIILSVNLRKRIKTDFVLHYSMLDSVKCKEKTAGVSSIVPQGRRLY